MKELEGFVFDEAFELFCGPGAAAGATFNEKMHATRERELASARGGLIAMGSLPKPAVLPDVPPLPRFARRGGAPLKLAPHWETRQLGLEGDCLVVPEPPPPAPPPPWKPPLKTTGYEVLMRLDSGFFLCKHVPTGKIVCWQDTTSPEAHVSSR